MKKLIFLLGFLILTINAYPKKIKAVFSNYTFNTPENKPYIEANLSVNSKSVNYTKLTNGKFQASIQISLICKNSTGIVNADKYNLLSPEIEDTSKLQFSFIDQKRLSLPNGDYDLELNISDNADINNHVSATQKIKIDFQESRIGISDIALVESYQKANSKSNFNRNGYDLIPMIDNFYPTQQNKLTFYNEIYNTAKLAKDESFLLMYYIQNVGGTKLVGYLNQKKVTSKDIIITLAEFDITNLQSGNYNIIIELRNKMNEIVASQSTFFQRSNKSLGNDLTKVKDINIDNSFASEYSLEQMVENIKCLQPISSQNEIEFEKTLVVNKEIVQMKQFLIYFWQKRNEADPATNWKNYELEVKKVNESFSSKFTKGYNTDRGIIYLRYGPPSNVRRNDMDNRAFPYEIWHYYKIKTFSNRRFVFYSPDNLRNELILLHSDLSGERNDPQWKYKILGRTLKSGDIKQEDTEYSGSRLEQDYND